MNRIRSLCLTQSFLAHKSMIVSLHRSSRMSFSEPYIQCNWTTSSNNIYIETKNYALCLCHWFFLISKCYIVLVEYNVDIIECSSSPCMNGATCIAVGWLSVYLICSATEPRSQILKRNIIHYVYAIWFFLISKCDIVLVDIDECSSNPCMNGATCTDAVNSYTCACVTFYTGSHCETGGNFGLSNIIVNIIETFSAFVGIA